MWPECVTLQIKHKQNKEIWIELNCNFKIESQSNQIQFGELWPL